MNLSHATYLKLNLKKLVAWYTLMEEHYKVTVVEKRNSFVMKVIAFFLGIFSRFSKNITTRDEFMDDFTTTLWNTVYVSYSLEDMGDMGYSNHIPHIMHEWTHVKQFREHPVMMPLKYLFSSTARARYEVECFLTYIEYAWKYELIGPDDAKLAAMNDYVARCLQSLTSYYGISAEEAARLELVMKQKIISVAQNPSAPENTTDIVETGVRYLRDLGAI